MRDLTPLERAGIEQLIDVCGLSSMLTAISDICAEKAEHIRTNWQDRLLASDWDMAGDRIERITSSIVGRGL